MTRLDPAAVKTRLYSVVLSDVLDKLGHPGQAPKPFVRPLDEASVLCGFARTGLNMKRYQSDDTVVIAALIPASS
jgi:hypothetical protein